MTENVRELLNKLAASRTAVSIDLMSEFADEEPFMAQAVDILEQTRKATMLLASLITTDEDRNFDIWDQRRTILAGLLIRSYKLIDAFLDQTCKKRQEIASILARCVFESTINLTFLLTFDEAKNFTSFVTYSLRTEKRIIAELNSKVQNRGNMLPIESRILESCTSAIKNSGFSPDQIDGSKRDDWCGGLYQRMKKLGIQANHLFLISTLSHSVHGNWQDLITYHVESTDDGYGPSLMWTRPRPQMVQVMAYLVSRTNKLYLASELPDCDNKSRFDAILDNIIADALLTGEGHEQFLSKAAK